jgi:hypothetical protein
MGLGFEPLALQKDSVEVVRGFQKRRVLLAVFRMDLAAVLELKAVQTLRQMTDRTLLTVLRTGWVSALSRKAGQMLQHLQVVSEPQMLVLKPRMDFASDLKLMADRMFLPMTAQTLLKVLRMDSASAPEPKPDRKLHLWVDQRPLAGLGLQMQELQLAFGFECRWDTPDCVGKRLVVTRRW